MGIYNKVRHEIRWFLLRRLPTCQQMMPLFSASFERRLTVRERVVVYLHQLVCVWCEWYVVHLQHMRDASREQGGVERAEQLSQSVRLDDDARARILKKLKSGEPKQE